MSSPEGAIGEHSSLMSSEWRALGWRCIPVERVGGTPCLTQLHLLIHLCSLHKHCLKNHPPHRRNHVMKCVLLYACEVNWNIG